MRRQVLIRYLGGKTRLVPWILENVGSFEKLVEPFCGGAALFFESKPKWGWLNDIADWPTTVFTAVRDDPMAVYKHVREYSDHFFHEDAERRYYDLRNEYQSLVGAERAASHIVLSVTGFNGLTRFDKNGKWNVAFGKRFFPESVRSYPLIRLYDYEHFKYYSEILKNTSITNLDFEEVIDGCGRDQFVYCDPPYLEYNGGYVSKWTKDDVVRLRSALERFLSRGGKFAVSEMGSRDGKDHTRVKDLWSGFHMVEKPYSYQVGVNKSKTLDTELLVLSHPPSRTT